LFGFRLADNDRRIRRREMVDTYQGIEIGRSYRYKKEGLHFLKALYTLEREEDDKLTWYTTTGDLSNGRNLVSKPGEPPYALNDLVPVDLWVSPRKSVASGRAAQAKSLSSGHRNFRKNFLQNVGPALSQVKMLTQAGWTNVREQAFPKSDLDAIAKALEGAGYETKFIPIKDATWSGQQMGFLLKRER